jgi:hypothetical protein
MNPGRRIDYKTLREVNPEASRLAVLEYLKTNGRNISDAARVFGINRSVVDGAGAGRGIVRCPDQRSRPVLLRTDHKGLPIPITGVTVLAASTDQV